MTDPVRPVAPREMTTKILLRATSIHVTPSRRPRSGDYGFSQLGAPEQNVRPESGHRSGCRRIRDLGDPMCAACWEEWRKRPDWWQNQPKRKEKKSA
jgi:hypothetical protein